MYNFELVELNIQNFRCIDDMTIHPGSYVITGPNGSGKTSILLAIHDALYGLSNDNCKKGSEKNCMLNMKFVVDNEQFEIIRRPGSAILKTENEEIKGVRQVNAYISGLLPKTIIETFVLNLRNFPELSATEKKDIFDFLMKIQDIDKYVTATDYLIQHYNNDINNIKGALDVIESDILLLQREYEQKSTELKLEQEKYNKLTKQIDNQITTLNNLLSEKQKELNELTKPEKPNLDKQSIEDAIHSYQQQILMLKDKLDQIRQIGPFSEEIYIGQLEGQLKSLDSKIKSLESDKQLTKVKLDQKIKELEDAYNKLETDPSIVVLNNKMQELKEEYKRLNSVCPICKQPVNEKIVSDKCEACNQPVPDRRQEIEEHIQSIENQKAAIVSHLKRKIKEFENVVSKDMYELQNYYEQLESEINKLKKQYVSVEKEIEINKDILEKKKQEAFAKLKKETEELRLQIDKLAMKQVEKEAQLRKLIHAEKEYEKQLELYNIAKNKLISDIEHIQNTLDKLHKEKERLNPPNFSILDNIIRKKKAKEKTKIEKIEQEKIMLEKLENYKFWKKMFRKNLRTVMLQRTLPTVNFQLSKYMYDILPQVVIHNNEFHVVGNNRFYKMLSTGEKRICCFLTNLVLFSKLINSNILAFDEVFDGMDNMNISRTVEILNKIAETRNVIVITHNKQVSELLDNFNEISMGETYDYHK